MNVFSRPCILFLVRVADADAVQQDQTTGRVATPFDESAAGDPSGAAFDAIRRL
jgi:hypothetical protein